MAGVQRTPEDDKRESRSEITARQRGRVMAAKIKKEGKLSEESKAQMLRDLGFFEGTAWETYVKTVRPTWRAVTEIDRSETSAPGWLSWQANSRKRFCLLSKGEKSSSRADDTKNRMGWRWWRRCAPRHAVRRPRPGFESQRVRANASARRRQPGAWVLCCPAPGWRQPKPHLSPRFRRRTAPPTARPRQFSLDVRGAWRDNGPVLPVAACNPPNGHCLNRHTDDALLLPGLVQLEIIPPTTRGTLWRLPPRPTMARQQPGVGWAP